MDQRFSCFLDPSDLKFSPLTTAACFPDPTVTPEALIEHEDEQIQELLRKAEDYIAKMVPPVTQEEEADENEEEREASETIPSAKRSRFRFLSKSKCKLAIYT